MTYRLGTLPEKHQVAGRRYRFPCPVHGSKGDSLSLSMTGNKWHCFSGCDQLDVRDALLDLGIIERTGEARPEEPEDRWWQVVWSDAFEGGSRVRHYLRGRGILRQPHGLRYNPRRGQMVARLTDPLEAHSWTGVHVTFLKNRARKMYGRAKGSAVDLTLPSSREPDSTSLLVGEGIESTLSLVQIMQHGGLVFAAISAAGMGAVGLPEGVRDLVIAADFDGSGLMGAERLERRAVKQLGITPRVLIPRRYRTDWNDELMALNGAGQ